MSMHEKAPENFVKTFNKAWDVGLQASIWALVFLLCYFFYGLGGWGPFIGVLFTAAVLYGAYRLFHALFIGPKDPDKEDQTH